MLEGRKGRKMTMSDVDDGAEKTQPLLAEHKRLLDHVDHIRIAAFEPRATRS